MMNVTVNYKLKKPEGSSVVNIEDFNENADILDGKLKELEIEVSATKKSVSDGKTAVAAAITRKKIPTAADASFAQMATNINNIISGAGNALAADVLAGKTFTNSTGVETVGTIPNKSGAAYVYSTLADAGGGMGNVNSITDHTSKGDSAVHVNFTVPKGNYDGNTSHSLRFWGIDPANVKAGRQIGYLNTSLKGTFSADATATASQLLSGYAAYVNGSKITGTIAVQSILSFSAAVYSSTAITFTWKNPAKGAPSPSAVFQVA